MADIPVSDTLNTLTDSCKSVYHEDRWYNKFSKGGNWWCSNQGARCDPDDKYTPSDDKDKGESQDCGCASGACSCPLAWDPNNKCAWAKFYNKHESQRCLAKSNVYPTDDNYLLRCCTGDIKEIDCHPSFCVTSKPCNQFMANYCFNNHQDQFFGKACTKWITKGYAPRNTVLEWAISACNKTLNDNINPTNKPKFIEWCKNNIKANPGKFDQVMNRFCNNSQNINDPLCSCYGVVPIPGASQNVPKMCLGECNKTGYLSNQMETGKCAITICNTNLQIDNNQNTTIEIDQLVQKCEAQVGDSKVAAGNVNTNNNNNNNNNDNNTNTNTDIKSMFPPQIITFANKIGLNKIAKQLNISLDVLIFIIIFSIIFIILYSDNNNNNNNNNNQNYPSYMYPQQSIYPQQSMYPNK